MARQYAVDDSNWDEVTIINGYAVFMGYLTTGVRGLGVLIVTWTTVVLLGGFVSDIGRKDFWCLTGITLVQTAGVFDFLLKEKLSDVLQFCFGLAATIAAAVRGGGRADELQRKSKLIAVILIVIQVLVLGIILCPLGVLYMFGLYISAGVSLWRLIEHDFGNEGGANQKPALQVLYGLAVAQGVLFAYKTTHALGAKNRLTKFAAGELITVDEELVAEYLEETVAGCEKDPSFAKGRNFVTYGVGLITQAKSNEGFIAGIRVLGGAIKDDKYYSNSRLELAEHLLTSRSDFWIHLLHRLLQVVGTGSSEVREHATRIVALVASAIRLEQFPGVIQCISWVLVELEGPSADKECSERRDKLLTEVAKIIQQLAGNEDNRRIMSKAVIPRFGMSLLKLHKRDHGPILERYWVQWLVAAIKETSSQRRVPEEGQPAARAAGAVGEEIVQEEVEEQLHLQSTIVGPALGIANSNLNRTIKGIFDCLDCGVTQKMQGVQILLHLSLDMSFIMGSESSRRRLTWILMLVFDSYASNYKAKHWLVIAAFTGSSMDDILDSIIRLAAEKLFGMLRQINEPRAMAPHVIGDITSAFADDSQDISIRIHAAMIMEHICTTYDKAGRLDEKVEGILADTIMKVVKEILVRCASIGEERQAEHPDLEKGVSEDDVLESMMHKEQFRKALVSLCQGGYMKHPTLRPKFEKIAVEVCKEQRKSFEDFKSFLV